MPTLGAHAGQIGECFPALPRAAYGSAGNAAEPGQQLLVSVVVPARDEAGNLPELCREIAAALSGHAHEILVVDDGSTDHSQQVLSGLRSDLPTLRVLRHAKSHGQSAAIRTGVLAARGNVIATMDGDGQNVPADIPRLLAVLQRPGLAMVAGWRQRRQDVWIKRTGSRLANRVRRWALQDGTNDTGCGLKVFSRQAYLRLPYFDHMHRFLPALMQREGYGVISLDVAHRHRRYGMSHYGTLDRLLVGIVDLLGVMWLNNRFHAPPHWVED